MWTGFQKPKRLSCDLDTLTDRYGRFYAQPFERGFGTTIGNSLRRALLSSIEGAAITAIRIEGVLHEFSSHHTQGTAEILERNVQHFSDQPIRAPTRQLP